MTAIGHEEYVSPWGLVEPERSEHGAAVARLLPVAIAALVVVLLLAKGRLGAALVLVVVVAGITQARVLSPRFERRFASALDGFGRTVGHVLRWVLLLVVFVLVFVPLSLVMVLFRSRPLGRPRAMAGDGWIPRAALSTGAPARRTFGTEPGRWPGAQRSKLVTAVFVLVVVMVVDVTAGAVLAGTGVLPPADRGDLATLIRRSSAAGMAAPAIASEPWAAQFGEDMVTFELENEAYVPYLVRSFYPYRSTYVNTTDRERVSYEPAPVDGVRPLRVAFFGGSVMFGVGQRDEHTIPSEFARVAEENGVAVEVHNYGFPGWVSWQEQQYFENLLAEGQEYDLAVFLDGFNEFDSQYTDYSPNPTHHSAGAIQGLIADFRRERQSPPGYGDGLGELASAYRRNSAVARVVDRLTGRQVPIPGSSYAATATPEERTDAALDIYGRSLRRIDDLGEDHGVPTHYFWQPRVEGWTADILDRLPPGVTDLSGSFAGREGDLYIDEVHTNEEGARLVAEAMWAELGDSLTRRAGSD